MGYVMYTEENIQHTLEEDFITPPILAAQKSEYENLKRELMSFVEKTGEPLAILDIGVASGRIPTMLKKDGLWEKISLYVGMDNSEVQMNRAAIAADPKIRFVLADALDIPSVPEISSRQYNLILCTYFTAGNFKPDAIDISGGNIKPYPKEALEPNQNFIKVFRDAYNLLKPGGKIILGSVYIDSEANRLKQEEFYKNCGLTIISTPEDSFSATKEGFWSQRFTHQKLYEYFYWISREDFYFIPLANDSLAEMVIISKR